MKAPWTEWRKDNLPPQLDLDVQAVLTVLGRRTRTHLKGETESLNLVRVTTRERKASCPRTAHFHAHSQ